MTLKYHDFLVLILGGLVKSHLPPPPSQQEQEGEKKLSTPASPYHPFIVHDDGLMKGIVGEVIYHNILCLSGIMENKDNWGQGLE